MIKSKAVENYKKGGLWFTKLSFIYIYIYIRERTDYTHCFSEEENEVEENQNQTQTNTKHWKARPKYPYLKVVLINRGYRYNGFILSLFFIENNLNTQH